MERREAGPGDETSTGENAVNVLGHFQTKCVVGQGAINKDCTEAVVLGEP